eukprot:TRINITY_DN4504_c0_g1_i2.p1 TRINITY_DN4504_c0_g1~~TRINITY_DN4504_c0_g1_i2.p1  ORF type:complete len:222 (+),score=37.48 TRINITY_DN4504_c0_g1_i2:45-668(+)
MPIYYALVSRGDCVLAHFATTSGNFVTYTSLLLSKLSNIESKQASYSSDNYLFHCIVQEGLIYLCLTDNSYDSRLAMAFLLEVRERFLSRYPDETIKEANAFDLNTDFSRILSNQMDYFTHNPSSDKIELVKKKLESTHSIVIENIEKVMQRNEKAELLIGKTEAVAEQASKFKSQSEKLKWVIWKKNAKFAAGLLGFFFLLWLLFF